MGTFFLNLMLIFNAYFTKAYKGSQPLSYRVIIIQCTSVEEENVKEKVLKLSYYNTKA